MELYATKTRWKWLLFVFAALIFLVIIFYSNKLIKNMAQEERRRMSLWADAISYRAELVNHTESFFDQIRIEEGKRAAILGKACCRAGIISLLWISGFRILMQMKTPLSSVLNESIQR